MSTVLIVIGLIVVFVIIVALVLYFGPGTSGGRGGLKRRFGPEYDRVVAQHQGDTKAAENELKQRVDRHGDLRPRPLTAEQRESYVARWGGLQERFVDAPRDAVGQAERLLAALAADRGFPAADSAQSNEEQVEALSVHHPHQVDGYRRMRLFAARDTRADVEGEPSGGAEHGGESTEELRTVMVEARQLFEQLILARPDDAGTQRRGVRRIGGKESISMRPKGSNAS